MDQEKKNPIYKIMIMGLQNHSGRSRMRRVISQIILFEEALGNNSLKEFRYMMPSGAYREIMNPDTCPITNIKEAVKIPSRITNGVHKSAPKVSTEGTTAVQGK